MKVYLHDIPLSFHKVSPDQFPTFDHVVKGTRKLSDSVLQGDVLFEIGDFRLVSQLLDILQAGRPPKLTSVTITIEDKKQVKKFFKARYNYIKASGGLVLKEGSYLLIYRLKKWDLPKGKLEKGENILQCAIREVEEECSVKVVAGPKIGSTWHCYPTKNGWCVKRSTWYLMECTDDTEMAPQYQEDIEDIVWVAPQSVEKYLANSYGNIQDVFHKARVKQLI